MVLIAGEPNLTDNLISVALVAAGAATWGIGQVMIKALVRVGGFTLIAWVAVFATPQLFLSSWMFEQDQLGAVTGAGVLVWSAVIYLALIMTALGYGIWYSLLGKYRVNQVMPFLLLLPVTTVLGGVFLLGEEFTQRIAVGGILAITGVAIINMIKEKPAPKTPQPRLARHQNKRRLLVPLHFSDSEMAERRERATTAMQKKELDGLLMFKQESMYYLTGYDSFGFSMFQCLYMDSDGNTTLLTRLPDLRQAKYTSDISDIRLWHDIEGVNPGESLRDMLLDKGCRGKKLGIEFRSYGLTAHNWLLVQKALDGFCKISDASDLVDRLRAIKSPQEVKYARRAAELADDALDEAIRLARPGVSEGTILAAMQGAVFEGGGDYAGNEFIIGSGPAALLVRYVTGRRTLDDNDQLTLEFAGAYRRYHAAMMRTLIVGNPHPRHVEMHQVCVNALHACMEVVKPDNTMGQVYDAHARVMDEAGYREHRMKACGYGMGAVYNPLWVDPPMFHEGNPVVIKPNNIFFLHMILANSEAGQAMTLGQTVLVTESGCESLSRSGLELVVNYDPSTLPHSATN